MAHLASHPARVTQPQQSLVTLASQVTAQVVTRSWISTRDCRGGNECRAVKKEDGKLIAYNERDHWARDEEGLGLQAGFFLRTQAGYCKL